MVGVIWKTYYIKVLFSLKENINDKKNLRWI